jgi:hypothetical protein
LSNFPLQPGETFYRKFAIRGPDNARITADALPSVTVYRNGAATSIPVTVAQLSPIEYDTSFVVPSNAVTGDSWQYLVEATVNGFGVTQFAHLSQYMFAGDAVQRGFTLRDGTGQSIAADVTSPENPTGVIVRNNVDESTIITIIADPNSPTQGRYIFLFTVDVSWDVGDELQMRLNATLDGLALERLWFLGQIQDATLNIITISALRVEEETLDIEVEDVAPEIVVEEIIEDIVC